MEPKYSQCCKCWNGLFVLRHINCRQNLGCLSWLLVQAVVCKPCLCSQSRCGSKAVTQQTLLCSSFSLFVTEAGDLAQEEVLQSLDHMLREETLKVLDGHYWTSVISTAKPIVFLLNQLYWMHHGKKCFFQERENSQDSTVAEKSREYPPGGAESIRQSHLKCHKIS